MRGSSGGGGKKVNPSLVLGLVAQPANSTSTAKLELVMKW
jgi:hypothetical protein